MVILITGSSRGIGEHLTGFLSGKGHAIVGCGRSFKATTYPYQTCDVSNQQEVSDLIAFVKKDIGWVDALINCAGIASMNHSILTPIETVRQMFNTNAVGTYLVSREAVKIMPRGSGRIINFSSIASQKNLEGEAAYAASKSAIESITRIHAKEFAPFGVTVNAIGPNPIQTDLIRGVPKDKLEKLVETQAIKRMGTMQDVENVVEFYLRKESNFITGQTIYLGGP